jgi:hypothetical protein
MKITITKQQLTLLQKRKAAFDESQHEAQLTQIAFGAAQEKAKQQSQALADVIVCLASITDLTEFPGFQFGEDETGLFLDLKEAPKPVSPEADPPTPPAT